MSRLRSNCNVIDVLPSELDEVISVTPAMWLNWRSRGVAMEEAVVSGLPPGKLADTEMVREIDLWQRRNRQNLKRNDPDDDNTHCEQSGGYWPVDEGGGDVHFPSAGCGSSPAAGDLREELNRFEIRSKKM